jgi:tRNA(adenine34) deaminase
MEIRMRASVLCVQGGKLLVVCLKDPVSSVRYRFPPGGLIEKGESPKQAAIREAAEETGYCVSVAGADPLIVDYPFVWAGKVYACRTHFFQASIHGEPRPVSGREKIVESVEWVDVSTLLREWTSHPELRNALTPVLEKNQKLNRKKV